MDIQYNHRRFTKGGQTTAIILPSAQDFTKHLESNENREITLDVGIAYCNVYAHVYFVPSDFNACY